MSPDLCPLPFDLMSPDCIAPLHIALSPHWLLSAAPHWLLTFASPHWLDLVSLLIYGLVLVGAVVVIGLMLRSKIKD